MQQRANQMSQLLSKNIMIQARLNQARNMRWKDYREKWGGRRQGSNLRAEYLKENSLRARMPRRSISRAAEIY